jgi:hypothetical protein
MNPGRRFLRWTAIIVLLNVVLGFCVCLREDFSPGGSKDEANLSASTAKSLPDCGDNCESCICHATLVLTAPTRFLIVLAMSGAPSVPGDSVPDFQLIRISHPPRG